MTKLTHVKTLSNPNYIGSHNLQIEDDQYGELTVEVSGVTKEEVFDTKSKARDEKDRVKIVTVVHLVNQKPFILNTINRNSLIELFGTPFVEKWAGKKFTLYANKIRSFGKSTMALRVREITTIVDDTPAALPALTPESKPWAATIEALRSGKTTVEALKLRRLITDEDGATLMAAQIEGEVI